MRSTTWARWASCALAIMIAVPAATADQGGSKKSIARCTSFDQVDKDEDTVELTIHNSCTIPVDCEITWRLVCAPESKSRRATHKRSAKFTLTSTGQQAATASAAVCGDDGWTMDGVSWSCEPNKD